MAFFQPQKELLTEQQYQELIKMYEIFLYQHNDHFLSHDFSEKLCTLSKNIIYLKITLPFDRIKNIFERTGLIVLKQPINEDILLIGCGNSPIDRDDNPFYRNVHRHNQCFTINPDLLANPSIVAFFGKDNEKLSLIFAEFDKKFGTVDVEAVSPIAKDYCELSKFNYSFLRENFRVTHEAYSDCVYEGVQGLSEDTEDTFKQFDKQSSSKVLSLSSDKMRLITLAYLDVSKIQGIVTDILMSLWGEQFNFAENKLDIFIFYRNPAIGFRDEKSIDEFASYFSPLAKKNFEYGSHLLTLETREDIDIFYTMIINKELPAKLSACTPS